MGQKLILKNVRFSFVRVFEAEDRMNSGRPAYSVTLLIPKNDKGNIKKVKAAILAMQKEYLDNNPKLNDKLPKGKWNPIHDGDEEDRDGYEGCYYIRCSRLESKGRPVVIDRYKQPITSKEEIYSGCWGVASIDCFLYDANGNKGITFGLNGLQKVREDESLGGGGGSAASIINDFDEEDDDTDVDDLLDENDVEF